MDTKKIKIDIIRAGERAVKELIDVAKEKIIKPDPEDELAADRLKNAAATKKLAIFDAFEILKRIEEERDKLDGIEITPISSFEAVGNNLLASKVLGK